MNVAVTLNVTSCNPTEVLLPLSLSADSLPPKRVTAAHPRSHRLHKFKTHFGCHLVNDMKNDAM